MKIANLIKRTIIVTITAVVTVIIFSIFVRMCITLNTVPNDEMLKSEFRE